MSARRLKLTILLVGLALNAIIVLAWTQLWVTVELDDGQVLEVAGDAAAPAVSTLALSGLVLIGALAIAGPVFRVVLGVLQSLLGATITLSGAIALLGPAAASSAVVTAATGVTGAETIDTLVATATLSAWSWIATIAGVLLVILGVATVATARRWPDSSRKYSALRTEAVESGDPVQDWDTLSSGDDPTDSPSASR
jgi:hypothetical protein